MIETETVIFTSSMTQITIILLYVRRQAMLQTICWNCMARY